MNKISIVGAREHNLKNVSLEIPRDKLVVFTGLSGSGKSSLAFDTIYAEGQRRYVESLSSYARQFLGMMEKPDVDSIEGLSPAISIDQKSATRNPRSTVGTITEIYDYMRLLFARIGTPHCPNCGKPVDRQTVAQITESIVLGGDKTRRLAILAPYVMDRKGEHKDVLQNIKKAGFPRVRIDGVIMELEEANDKTLDKNNKHNIEAVIDRVIIENGTADESNRSRIYDSVEKGLHAGNGRLLVHDFDTGEDKFYSELSACADCGISIPEIEPRSFSFNSPHGACQNCQGLGVKQEIDPKRVLPNPKLSVYEGGVRPWVRNASQNTWHLRIIEAMADKYNIDLVQPISKMTKEELRLILWGTGDQIYKIGGYETKYEGVIPNMERRYKETDSDYIRHEIEKYMVVKTCPVCEGKKLKKEILGVKIDGKNISDVATMDIAAAKKFFSALPEKLSAEKNQIGNMVFKEICERLQFLLDVGLSYLTIDRNATTLSGGEAQRIRLATQIGSGLMGVLYILDEPSIGLHQKDNGKLLKTLVRLRDLGNTVIVVEHDEETIREADFIVDIGPGAGEHGGEIVAIGSYDDIINSPASITGQYLSGKKKVKVPKVRRPNNGKVLRVVNASENNLKNIDVTIPLNSLVCVTGVSGSGKSTLVNDILAKHLSKVFHRAKADAGEFEKMEGLEHLDKVIDIDQSPIGKSPRSNTATYTGIFTQIRDLFALTSDAKKKGYKTGRFSFNVKGGRCEKCRGEGVLKIEMHFLPDVYITCEDCKGKRYNAEALEIQYKGKNISDVLNLTVEEALNFFDNITAIRSKLQVLVDVGLGYIKLGQPATTLSGGEAQRIKLATELAHRGTGKTMYILDEPTTGLHFDDVNRLIGVLTALVEKGNTVLVIEHNLDVIKSADHIIDLGPEGGHKGGQIVATGTPEEVAKKPKSFTGFYLKEVLK
ncbi:MAG: excinuclease ABC subunit UvrA [Candidatus Berkelbacteria bacterium]